MLTYKKILIKFSGEAFGDKGGAIQVSRVNTVVAEIKALRDLGVKVGIVCGGGNISRWKDNADKNADRVTVDYKGMKGTLTNVIALEKALKKAKVKVSVSASFALAGKYPAFDYKKVKKNWDKGEVIIFAGGTGYPFFSTDMSAVLYSLILQADLFIKATKVDGVYSADPTKTKNAKKFATIPYQRILEKNLAIIDGPAVCLARDNNLKIKVIKWELGNVVKTVQGKSSGTIIS